MLNKLLTICENLEDNGGSSSSGISRFNNISVSLTSMVSNMFQEDRTPYLELGPYNCEEKMINVVIQAQGNPYEPLSKIVLEQTTNVRQILTIYNLSTTGDDTKDNQYGTIKFELCKLKKGEEEFLALKMSTNMSDKNLGFAIYGHDINGNTGSGYAIENVFNDQADENLYEESVFVNSITNMWITTYVKASTQPAIA